MKRRIKINEPEYLEIAFADGTVKKALICNATFIQLVDEYGSVEELSKCAIERPFDFCAKLLYLGLKIVDSTIEYKEAASIISKGGIDIVAQIMEIVNEEAAKMNLPKEG